jgi:hypothetical protein
VGDATDFLAVTAEEQVLIASLEPPNPLTEEEAMELIRDREAQFRAKGAAEKLREQAPRRLRK